MNIFTCHLKKYLQRNTWPKPSLGDNVQLPWVVIVELIKYVFKGVSWYMKISV